MYCIIVVLLYLINPDLFIFDGVLGASFNFCFTLLAGEMASLVLFLISSLEFYTEPGDDEFLSCYFNFKVYKEICSSHRPNLNLAGIIILYIFRLSCLSMFLIALSIKLVKILFTKRY